MTTIKVLLIILDMELAGAQEVVRTLSAYLPHENCQVTVCTFHDGPMRAKLEALGLQVHLIQRPRHGIIKLPLFLAEMRRVRSELATVITQHQIEVVQTFILEVLDFVVLSLKNQYALKAVFISAQNVELLPTMPHWLLKPKRAVYKALYQLSAHLADGFIACSNEVKTALQEQVNIPADSIITINNAIDTTLYDLPRHKDYLCNQLGLPLTANLIGTIGRLTTQKGQQYLISALPTILKTHPETHLLIMGIGELESELKAQAEQIGYNQQIYFLGLRDDVPQFLASLDIFVMPSLWEGLSLALLQAMASGCPIVVTDVSGSSQVIIANETGMIVPPANPKSLAQTITTMLTDKEKARQMGQLAKAQVTALYGAKHQAQQHAALYQKTLADSNRLAIQTSTLKPSSLKQVIPLLKRPIAPLCSLPNFVLLGGQHCSATQLYDQLIQHDYLTPSLKTSIHFFDNHYQCGLMWYRHHFPLTMIQMLSGKLTGEVSPSYLAHPEVPRRMAKHCPHLKLIILLDNPVKRAYAHYQYEVAQGFERSTSFEEALALEPLRLHNELDKLACDDYYTSFNYQHYGYLHQGLYIHQLKVWHQYFSPHQIFIINTETFHQQPIETLIQIFNFLEIPSQIVPIYQFSAQSLSFDLNNSLSQRLTAYFRPYNQQLYNYLDQDFGWER